MQSDSAASSTSALQELVRVFLPHSNTSPTASNLDSPQPATTATSVLTAPPRKNTIRFIDNDQNNRREKYDGHRWRLVCAWGDNACNNVTYSRGLCGKHHSLQRNKEGPIRKTKSLVQHVSSPNRTFQARATSKSTPKSTPTVSRTRPSDDDDDIQIIEICSKKPTARSTPSTTIKREFSDFNIFSVDYVDESPSSRSVKPEPHSSNHPKNDIEFIAAKPTAPHGLNITELVSKKIPPLTEFEEECLAARMIERLSTTCLMLDAQLFLHREATEIVKRNYRLKMDTIAQEYFYDFLLRHPRVAIHFKRWFSRCKFTPPTTGCPIDTKVWSLGMIVRGATSVDSMIDECED